MTEEYKQLLLPFKDIDKANRHASIEETENYLKDLMDFVDITKKTIQNAEKYLWQAGKRILHSRGTFLVTYKKDKVLCCLY